MPTSYAAKERMIREKRTIEATRKNMMGASGKLGMIAKWCGSKITRQGGGLFESSYLDDPFFEESEIPMMDDHAMIDEGWHFDGLSRGMHFEIRYLHANTELCAWYKGYLVYKEIAGDLYTYAPFPEWEDEIVESLVLEAEQRAEKQKEEFGDDQEQSLLRLGQMFLHKLRMRWGI